MDLFDFGDIPQSKAEEIANAASHGFGLLLALIALPVLLATKHETGDALDVIAAGVFSLTLILLYLASTLYHSVPHPESKKLLRVLDHSAIYLLIAGTYTPFTLGVLRGPVGWTLFGLIWALAFAGIVKKAIMGPRFPRLSTILYVVMGWLVVLAIHPLVVAMEPWGLFWLVAGGLSYTGGVVFYGLHRMRYHHLVWHLFVLTGSICHFIAVLLYASSPPPVL